jgi:hypothetical protein
VAGVEANLWGVLGLVAGLDLQNPDFKLPAFGRVGPNHLSAVASPRAR